jgi:hypothetical protein
MKMQLPNGATFEEFDDCSKKLITTDGNEITIDPAGNISANLAVLRHVGVKNLMEVESHVITDAFGARSHVVKFHGGGFAQFAYNSAGQLIELAGQNVEILINKDGDLTFSSFKGIPV